MKDFVHLHCHSDYSQLDGCATVEAYVEAAAERGYRAVAITDHGTMRGSYKLQEECNKAGIKALHGIEFYICDNISRKGLTEEEKKEAVAGIDGKAEQKRAKKELEEKLGVNKRYHITAWAQNNEGLRNLYRLSSHGWDEGYYYKPRIDLDLLEKYNSGILLGSGCIGSILNDAIHNKQILRTEKLLDRLCSVFGDRLYLEIMPHGFERQIANNNEIVRIHRKYGNKLLATQDSHYCSEDDVRFHEVMLAMNTQSKLSDENRFKFDGDSYWYKTRKEMKDSFNSHGIDKKYIIDSLNNTIEFADRCDAKIEIDPLKCLLPNVHIPKEFENENQYFLYLVKEGYRSRQIAKRAVAYSRQVGIAEDEAVAIYRKRMKHELGVLLKSGFVRYTLMIRDIYDFAIRAGIPFGPGRGSSSGSLIYYLVGITHVDPIQHNLMFERFISPGRQDMPDCDCDFDFTRREEIFDYIIKTYGEDKVAQISTHGTMAAKLAFKDVARTYDVPFSVANSLSMAIDSKEEDAIQKALDENDRMKEFNEKYPEVIEFAKKTEGLMKSVGLHAAGIVVSPKPLTDIVPVEVRRPAGKAIKCVAFDLKGVEGVGLLKIDILGLKTVTVIADAVKAIKQNGNELILEDIPLDDPQTIDGFTELDFVGIFQYDSSSSYAVCKGLKFKWFDDLAVITAINRPGAIAFAEEFKKRRSNEELAQKHIYHEKITRITQDAEGLMVFQEHLIKIAIEIAGFSPAEADVLRKAVGKKKMELLKSLGDKFLEGCETHTPDMPKETAEALFEQITKAGRYSFNRCITGDTIVTRASANRHSKAEITVEELFIAQNSKTDWGKKIRAGKVGILQMDEDNIVRPGKLSEIIDSGIQQVFEIVCENGMKIKATAEHRLLTKNGYRKIKQLKVFNELVVVGKHEKRKAGRNTDRAKGKTYNGYGMPSGEENPSYIDGRTRFFKESKKKVKERANGFCENCKHEWNGKERFEFAHIKLLEECGGDYYKYHHPNNMYWLCNSCHKKYDYKKGERKKRWSKGLPTTYSKIVSIKYVGYEQTYDIVMNTETHNFLANGIVSHNSHSICYGLLAYWTMYLKKHYPLEFYWALMKNSTDQTAIHRYARDAKRKRIETSYPDVNISGYDIAIDRKANSIRASLGDIKGLGPAAVKAIVKGDKPYTSFVDFLKKIKGRAVTVRTMYSLIESGALDSLLPNPRYARKNIQQLWELAKKKDWDAIAEELETSKTKLKWNKNKRLQISAAVNPLALPQHAYIIWESFLHKHIAIPFSTVTDELLSVDGIKAVVGSIISWEERTVGDSADSNMSSDKKAVMGWGKQWYKIALDGLDKNINVKLKWDLLPYWKNTIEKDKAVLIVGDYTQKYQMLNAHYIIDIKELSNAIKNKLDLNIWQQLAVKHPAKKYSWKDKKERSNALRNLEKLAIKKSGRSTVVGVVTYLHEFFDRNDGLMARLNLAGANGNISVLSFASSWEQFRDKLRYGSFVKLNLKKLDGKEFLLEAKNGVMELLNG